VIKRQPTHHRRDDDGDANACDQRQRRIAGAEACMREYQSGRIGSDTEKSRLPEGQDARVAPENIHRQRNRRIQESPDQAIDHVSRQHVGAGGDQQQHDPAYDDERAHPGSAEQARCSAGNR
jgi:hypothetical protein